MTDLKRCSWAQKPLMIEYHDKEWGVPVHDDQKLFEMLVLEGAQAGLNWLTVLQKRENYRKAFDGFDAAKIAQYAEEDVARLLADPGIIRNRLKINAAITNAEKFLFVQKEHGSFNKFIWSFTGGKPVKNGFRTLSEIPASTEISDKMSKALKKLGFKFVGSTICYAFMQAVGMVNDHVTDCFRYEKV